ncbi:MAG: transglutaminase family protein [Gammaproteobacteria bacterium]|nr:transglutaminase family protein [Gammaproteobacteria bacterium]
MATNEPSKFPTQENLKLEHYLLPTAAIDADHPEVIAFAQEVVGSTQNPLSQASQLYLAVRDRIQYDPYKLDLSNSGMKASRVLALGHGWCVTKSALLAAACRAVGIPARVGYADVHNHLSTRRLREVIGSDTYYWHGYAALYLHGKWVKATPVFDFSLCQKLKMTPLEFDGISDSILQACDEHGNRHMEYLRLRGEYADIPLAEMRIAFAQYYPKLMQLNAANFETDVSDEILAR